LEGSLNLEEFIRLEKLDCRNNCLTELKISKLSHLKKIRCEFNLLTNLDFLNNLPCPQKIISLGVTNNNFSVGVSLSFFSRFTNLEELYLDGSESG
jgi:hypothetical protein